MDTTSALGIALNAGRVAYGLAAVVAPGPAAAGWIGRAASDPSVHPMIRAFGIRDVALGAATIGALRAGGSSGTGARMLLALGVMVDATDAAAGALSAEHVPDARMIYAVAGGAAAAGLLASVTAATGDDGDDG